MMVLETGSKAWSRPTTVGEVPSARSETQIVYDPKVRVFMYLYDL